MSKYQMHSLLVLLVCLCKSFKELFFLLLIQGQSLKSGCKGTTFFRTSKYFCNFFSRNEEKITELDFRQVP